ncbi:MAG: hypothetical protein IFK94_05710, partial [Acidobacteria bacterium]|nr:hypothetical protein [Candidatus Polarisedimenticola svalbardensis]
SVIRAEGSTRFDYITSLFRDSKETLWVGTSGGGLRERLADGGFREYTKQDGLSSLLISAIGEDHAGVLWVGTADSLERWSGDRFVSVETPDSLDHNMVHVIFTDSRGDLWVGREWGLTRIGAGGMQVYGVEDGLASETVYALHEDERGDLWIGTTGGLSRYRDGAFVSLKRTDGLPDSGIYTMMEDDRDHLWMTANRGVIRIAKSQAESFWNGEIDKVRPALYGRSAGLRSTECSGGLQPAGFEDESGRLWFATVQGVVTIHPDELGPPRQPPGVVLDRAFVDRRSVDLYSPVELRHGDGEMEFQYAAVSLMDASDIRFRYRLDGFDETWREVGSQQVARYTNVPPGHYRFRVAASHGAGSWAENEAVLEVGLLPRFYQTNTFLAVVILGALLAAGSGYTLWTRQARARRRRLESLVAERTRSLKEATRKLEGLTRRQSDFVSGISHELKTPLTLIRLYAETLLENVGSTQEKRIGYSRIIVREVERLTRLVDRVLDFSRIEHRVKRYELQDGDLAGTVVDTAGAYESYLKEAGFTIRLDVDRPVPIVRFDADAIAMAVINLLENAAKYSGGSKMIDLRVRSRNSSVVVEVQDQGVGIPEEEQERIFERFYRVASDPGSGDYGIGLFVVRDVVNAHDGRVEVDSEPGRGSTFRMIFPGVAT